MQKALLRGILFTAVSAGVTDATAQQAVKTHCLATAGLAKHTAGTTTAGTERTGSFEVTITSNGPNAQLTADPKRPVSAGEATKVAAVIDRVLLRSPFKSEATALPASEAKQGAQGVFTASFELAAIRALPAGDVNVVLVTPDGERLCRIKGGDRRKLGAGQ